MTDKICSWKGCKTKIKIDTSFENSQAGKHWGVTVSGWCKTHSEQYNKQCDVFETLVDQYNKKQLKNKFGRLIKFIHHSDVSNYLYQYDRKEYSRIVKQMVISQ